MDTPLHDWLPAHCEPALLARRDHGKPSPILGPPSLRNIKADPPSP
ncbi:hypothetical protein G5B35_05090 [Parapusillimonas sp. SGNA-6]|nr:hypothetical protein [Parapusillimonas sp. SGNA-6]